MMNKIIEILKTNTFVLEDELGGKGYGENEIAEIYDGGVYFYNTLTLRCETDVMNWLQDLFKNEPVTVNLINCCCDENYYEIKL